MDEIKKLASDATKTSASSEGKRLASDKPSSAEIPIPSLHPQVTAQVETGSRKERIRKATLEGGLKNIPNGFDDKDGDWAIIKSENPFEVLYLDHEQYKSVTPEMVKDNFGILSDFWDEKIHQMMSSSATKTQSIQKYGGEQGTEKTIHSYRQLLDRAYKKISRGIENCFREIDTKRREIGEEKLQDIISGILADKEYKPIEKAIALNKGQKFGLRDDEIKEFLLKKLKAARFKPVGEIDSKAPVDELLDIDWFAEGYEPPKTQHGQIRAVKQYKRTPSKRKVFFIVVICITLGIFFYNAIVGFKKRTTSNENAYFNSGLRFLGKGQYDNAISDFTRAIESNQNEAAYYAARGMAYYNKKQYDKAIDDVNKAIGLDPDEIAGYFTLGLVYYDNRQYKKSIENYSKIIEINPSFYLAYFNRGRAFHLSGKNDYAIDDFTKTIELAPEFADAYEGRGYIYLILGKHVEGKKDLIKASELKKKNK